MELLLSVSVGQKLGGSAVVLEGVKWEMLLRPFWKTPPSTNPLLSLLFFFFLFFVKP